MKNDIEATADELAADASVTDYDFWRMLKDLEYEIFDRTNASQPIPFDMLRWRGILKRARLKRTGRESWSDSRT